MSSQIFKNKLPNNILFELLDKICTKTEKYYLLDNIAFRKGVFLEEIQPFLNKCMPYYYISKRKYLDRKLTFNNFTTVVRQICNNNKIGYTSQIKYDKSDYDIVYYIYYNN